ncbi:MAG: RDD family protein [Methanobacterium sp.]|uniref:RDD family protein n=1 Tax=Methanobacterium sp. TaxID=2164 RepID=UPI003D65885A|nr:RDD family protein [Methanobacterium sp.]
MEKLWGKRFLALIVDAAVITLIIWVLSALIYPLIAFANIYGILNYWLILTAIIIMAYFTYFEGSSGQTLGKSLMKIKVVADEGKIDYRKAFIRNLSKILWVPLIVDVIAGFAAGNSKIRYLDKIAATNVVITAKEVKTVKESEKTA